MSRINLTDKTIRALKTEELQKDYWDEALSGLGLRVCASGRKTFFCRYRLGKCQRRMTLGDFPALGLADARKKFRAIQNNVDDGRDPQIEKAKVRTAETVADLFSIFLEDREGRISNESIGRYKGIYRREFEKPLGKMKANELKKAHVIPILRELGDRAATQCERAQELLQAVFNHAVALDLLEFNPLFRLPLFGKARIGERHLSPEEVSVYLRALATLPPVEQSYFFLLLLYGARPGELSRWRWKWIIGDRVSIPGEFQKNGRPLVLPITAEAAKRLSTLRKLTGETPWLFPNPAGTGPRQAFRKNKARIETKMNLSEPWTLRDVRRTTETLLRELKTPAEVVSQILNHNTSQLRKIYDKSVNLAEKQKALLRFEKYLSRLGSGEAMGKVVQLPLPVSNR